MYFIAGPNTIWYTNPTNNKVYWGGWSTFSSLRCFLSTRRVKTVNILSLLSSVSNGLSNIFKWRRGLAHKHGTCSLSKNVRQKYTIKLPCKINCMQQLKFQYCKMPQHYVFNQKDTKWTLRMQTNNNIRTRMYSVSPRQISFISMFLESLFLRTCGQGRE